MSTIADVVSGVSNAKAALEGIFGVTPFTGDKLSGWEQGAAGAAIIGGPVVKVVTKIGKVVVKFGVEAFEKIKNALNSDKLKGFFKKVYDDYIKSPMQKGYTYYKEYKKKFDKIEYSSNRELAFEGGIGADSKTFGELANDIKNNTVHMFKKLDEVIGGKGTGKYTGGRTQKELDDLAGDPSHGGKIRDQGLKEREIGLDLEQQGKLGKIIRDPQGDGGAEFIDTTNNTKWDVKSFVSYPNGWIGYTKLDR